MHGTLTTAGSRPQPPAIEALPLDQIMPKVSRNPDPGERYWLDYRKSLIRKTRVALARAMEAPLRAIVLSRPDPEKPRARVRAENFSILEAVGYELVQLRLWTKYPATNAWMLEDGEFLVQQFQEACRLLLAQREQLASFLRLLIEGDRADFYASATELDNEPKVEPISIDGTVVLAGLVRGVGCRNGQPFVDFRTSEGIARVVAQPAGIANALSWGIGSRLVVHADPASDIITVTRLGAEAEMPVARRDLSMWKSIEARLDAAKAGWDTYGAPAVDERARATLRVVVGHLLATRGLNDHDLKGMNIGPSHEGGVSIEWDNDDRTLNVYIAADGSLSLGRSDEEDEVELQLEHSLRRIESDVDWLHSHA